MIKYTHMPEFGKFLGDIGRRIADGEPPRLTERQPLMSRSDSTFHPTYDSSAFLDQRVLDQEIESLAIETKKAQDAISKLSPIVLRSADAQRWQGLQAKFWEVVRYSVDIENKREVLQGEEATIRQLAFNRILAAGVDFCLNEVLRQERAFVRSHQFEDPNRAWDTYFAILEFAFAHPTSIRINEVTLRDIVDGRSAQLISPAPFCRFLTDSVLTRVRMGHNQVFEENTGVLERRYPNSTKNHIDVAVGYATFGMVVNDEDFDDAISRNKGIPKESLQWSKRLVKQIHMARDRARLVFFDHQSPHFPAMAEALNVYLHDQRVVQACAFLALGIETNQDIQGAYRRAAELAPTSLIYLLFFDTLNDLLDEYPTSSGMPTNEDIPAILLNEEENDYPMPPISELNSIVGKIFSMTSQKEYSIPTESIAWTHVIEPTGVEANFGNKPKQFTISLLYEDEIGETLDVELVFDTEKHKFDWSFLEAPDDPRMQAMKKAAIAESKAVLEAILKGVTEETRRRQAERQAKAVPTQPSHTPAKKTKEGYIPTQKEPRALRARVVTPIMMEIQKPQEESMTGLPKRRIMLPDEERLQKLLEEIGEYDRPKVLDDIVRFNQQGAAGFKPLNTEGIPKFELRIGSQSAKKGIRVILLLAENSQQGEKDFEIYGVWYRGEAFKRHRRKKLDAI